jgi:CRISPR-associated protein Cmr5
MSLRAHRVATAAFACVEARQSLPDKQRTKYGAIAHKLPGMILQNGLAQASGFLLAKGSSYPEHLLLLDDLNAVLKAGGSLDVTDRERLHQRIIAADLGEIFKLTRASLESAGWLKRYVQGLLRVSATGDGADDSQEP